MIVDCNECVVRGPACEDCVVTVLLGEPVVGIPPDYEAATGHAVLSLEQEEERAIGVLADSGLVPRLRLVKVAGAGGSAIPGTPDSCGPRRTG